MWLKELSAGNDDAFRMLFARYYPALTIFANKYIDDRQTAEDIVQDIFFGFWLKRRTFNDIISLEVYFYRSVRNKCLNILEHWKVQKKYQIEQNFHEESDFFMNRILEEEVYTLLRNAVESLPEHIRSVYDLALLGYDNSRIAEMLEITVDAVKSRKKRGKQQLQEILRENMSILLIFL